MKKEKKEPKQLWEGNYISLFDDGTIGVSDGVGCVGGEDDIKGLFETLKKYFEGKSK